ncbi:hypothetical protein [Micromonospora sp. NPDC049891]|uniref:hypothetical protein n=1 Tax=Micromonospora sp. NPDC049891 TaxID=3155655 RepID=UPI0033FD1A2C
MTTADIVTLFAGCGFWALFIALIWTTYRPPHTNVRRTTELRRLEAVRQLVAELTQMRDQLDTALHAARNETPDRPSQAPTPPHN